MKKLIALALGDLHFEDWKQFNEDGRRIDAHLSVWALLEEECIAEGVPLIFTGDLFHNPKHISNKLLAKVLPTLAQAEHLIIGIDGNHDQDSGSRIDNQPNSYFKTMSQAFPDTFKCINFSSYEIHGVVYHGVPYLTLNVGFEDYVKNIKLDKTKKNVLVIHSDLPGAMDTNNMEVGSVHGISAQYSKVFKRFDLVLSGHIHKYQQLASNVYMVGAPLQQRRTDRNCEMGYVRIYDDLSIEFVEIENTPKFKTYTDKPENEYDYWDKEIRAKKTKKENKVKKVGTSYKEIAKRYAQDKGISKIRTKKLIKLLK